LVRQGIAIGRTHGETWRMANRVRVGLESRLRRLYPWRLAADYATRLLSPRQAKQVLAGCVQLASQLGVEEER
jgi:hypothetical protein